MQHWFSRDARRGRGLRVVRRACASSRARRCAPPERLAAAAAELEADAAAHRRARAVLRRGRAPRAGVRRRADHSLVRARRAAGVGAGGVAGDRATQGVAARAAQPGAQQGRAHRRVAATRARDVGHAARRAREWLRRAACRRSASSSRPTCWTTSTTGACSSPSATGASSASSSARRCRRASGWLVEEWPRTRAAPNGTTHSLVDAAMRAFAAEGSQLRHARPRAAGRTRRRRRPRTQPRVAARRCCGGCARTAAASTTSRGLEAFKASMQPMSWEPIYAIAPGGRFTPRMLRAVAGAFSGGEPRAARGARAVVGCARRGPPLAAWSCHELARGCKSLDSLRLLGMTAGCTSLDSLRSLGMTAGDRSLDSLRSLGMNRAALARDDTGLPFPSAGS